MTLIEHVETGGATTQFNASLVPVLSSPDERTYFTGERIMHTSAQHNDAWEVHVMVAEGQTAWNPASTKDERRICGPAVVIYQGLTDRSGIRVIVF